MKLKWFISKTLEACGAEVGGVLGLRGPTTLSFV